jgi:hypothetical protein
MGWVNGTKEWDERKGWKNEMEEWDGRMAWVKKRTSVYTTLIR